MGAPSIVVEGVGKRFSLHQARAVSFRELLARRQAGAARPEREFWALRDVGFTVEPGHPLAIIGHNGSGKSTLLKLLTGILKPTQGKIDVRGRIGALIEVGAGFHPDLTGRENVYLNGSILGASRKEIDRQFDHIVAFAGLEKFIDTPVKRYSSGMYMRLGFSIAAHLEPEILLIDEVLAVGDAQFQSRCLGFLKRFVAQGGSVVFVSHVMGQVRELCDRCVWLDQGQMMGFGEATELIEKYEALVAEREEDEFQKLYPKEWAEQKQESKRAREREKERAERLAALLARRDSARARRTVARIAREREQCEAEEAKQAQKTEQERSHQERWSAEMTRLVAFESAWHEAEALQKQRNEVLADEARARCRRAFLDSPESFRIVAAELLDFEGHPTRALKVGEAAFLEVRYRAGRRLERPVIGVDFLRLPDQLHLFTVSNYDHQSDLPTPGKGTISLKIGTVALGQGRYRIRLATYPDCAVPEWFHAPEDIIESALEFDVDAGRFANGCAYLPTTWTTIE